MNYKEIVETVGLVAGLIVGFGAIAYIAEVKKEGWINALAIIWVPAIFIIITLIVL